ncbi:MAG: hypothetical protein WBY71_07195 [Nitrososphaeraceae archaeon]
MNNNKQFLLNQLVWMGLSIGISLTISLLMPFPISLVAIIGTFLLINFYLRKRMMARMNGGVMDGMFGPMQFNGSSVKYHCMNCGMEHKHVACPKCGSKMKKAGL